jgi:hypothetical protein
MQVQNNAWVFQNSVTTTGNGEILYPNHNDQVTIFITGTSTSRTIIFEGSDNDGNFYSIPAVKLPTLTIASSTTGTNEAWVIDTTSWVGIRCRVSAIVGGTVKIIGKVVESGTSLISNVSNLTINSDGSINTRVYDGMNTLRVFSDGSININNIFLSGITTEDGTDIGLIDSNKNFEADSLNAKTIKFTMDDIEYVRVITGSVGNTIGFPTLGEGTVASVTVTGSTGGSMVINCVETGVLGNDYSVILVAGEGISQPDTLVTFTDNLLTIPSPTDGDGNPTPIMPGNVEGIIDNTPELATLFDIGAYEAGQALDILSEAVPFEGGVDGVIVVSGVDYVVF